MVFKLTISDVCPRIELLSNEIIWRKRRVSIDDVSTESGIHIFRNKLAITVPVESPTCHITHN